MSHKIRVAFIKFGGLSAGGTERWLQVMAASLDREKFHVDYYYCDSAPYVGSDVKHTDTNHERSKYMIEHGVNLIRFVVGAKDITKPTHDWIDTNFWQVFDQSKYDIVQTAKAGPAEYPFPLLKIPVIEYVTLSAGVDFSPNIACSIHLSNWQRLEWYRGGGDLKKSAVIPIPVSEVRASTHLRSALGIPDDAVIAGFHQRNDDAIFSPVPLAAFKKIEDDNRHFIIMGGGERYREQAQLLRLRNAHFMAHDANDLVISQFLNTLDIFAHGRRDGETFGTVLAEAMYHGKPCLSHRSSIANAQPETMGPGGLFADDERHYGIMLEDLFSDPALRKKLGDKGRAHALKHYTPQGCIRRLEEIYEAVYLNKPKTSFSHWSYALSPLGFLCPGHLELKTDLAHHIFSGEIRDDALVRALQFMGRETAHARKILTSFENATSSLAPFAFAAAARANIVYALTPVHDSHPQGDEFINEVAFLNNWEDRFKIISKTPPADSLATTEGGPQDPLFVIQQIFSPQLAPSSVINGITSTIEMGHASAPLETIRIYRNKFKPETDRQQWALNRHGKFTALNSGQTEIKEAAPFYIFSVHRGHDTQGALDFERFTEDHNRHWLFKKCRDQARKIKRFLRANLRSLRGVGL